MRVVILEILIIYFPLLLSYPILLGDRKKRAFHMDNRHHLFPRIFYVNNKRALLARILNNHSNTKQGIRS